MYLHACVCVCVCIAGLMSWTVCLPPTALSEPAVIQTDSCISSLSLSLRHRRTPTTSPRLQQRAKKKKKKKKKRWHANNSPGWLGGGTNETSQGIRRRNERAVLKFELFLLRRFKLACSPVFAPPSPPLPRKTCIKDEPSSIVYNSDCERIASRACHQLPASFVSAPPQFPQQQETACKIHTQSTHTKDPESASS